MLFFFPIWESLQLAKVSFVSSIRVDGEFASVDRTQPVFSILVFGFRHGSQNKTTSDDTISSLHKEQTDK